MAEFLAYDPESLIGKSVFEYHHAQDSVAVDKAFKSCKYLLNSIMKIKGRFNNLIENLFKVCCTTLLCVLNVCTQFCSRQKTSDIFNYT